MKYNFDTQVFPSDWNQYNMKDNVEWFSRKALQSWEDNFSKLLNGHAREAQSNLRAIRCKKMIRKECKNMVNVSLPRDEDATTLS